MMVFSNYFSKLEGLSEFPFWFGFVSIYSSISGHAISVTCEFEYFTSNISVLL